MDSELQMKRRPAQLFTLHGRLRQICSAFGNITVNIKNEDGISILIIIYVTLPERFSIHHAQNI